MLSFLASVLIGTAFSPMIAVACMFAVVLMIVTVLGTVSETYKTTLVNAGITNSVTYTGANGSIDLSVAIPTGTTETGIGDQLISFGYATLQLIYLLSDQNVRLCVNDVHSSSPLFTLNLIGGASKAPWVWTNDGAPYFTNPFGTTNCTAFYWTNSSGQTANIVGEIIY